MTLLSSAVWGLSGCTDQNQVASMRPHDHQWKTTAERKSYFETIDFKRGVEQLTQDQKMTMVGMVKKMQTAKPIYVRLMVHNVIETSQKRVLNNRLQAIQKHLEQMGIKKNHIEVIERNEASMGKSGSGRVIIVFDQYYVVLPKCPGWEGVRSGSMPHGEEGFGCVNAYNAGLMIANPKDLYDAQRLSDGDAAYLSGGIDRLRQDKRKEIKIEKPSDSNA